MITSNCLGALRVAASLAHTLPGLCVRISHAERTLVDVRAVGVDEPGSRDDLRVMSPCEFRGAVGRAHRLHLAGRSLEIIKSAHGCDPTIGIGTPPGGASRPGGLFRVPRFDQHVWAFGTTLDADVAYPLGHDLVEAAQPLVGVCGFGLRRGCRHGGHRRIRSHRR